MTTTTELHPHQMIDVVEFFTYMLAGKATFTVVSQKTHERRTFKVSRTPDFSESKKAWFVNVLTEGDEYRFHGMIRANEHDDLWFWRSNKSHYNHESVTGRAWNHVFDNVINGERMPPGVELWHEGRCGRCGRTLTVPESIRNGIGPECATKE